MEDGGVRLFGPGLARRLGEREGRRLAPGDGDARRLGGGGEPEGRGFCCTGEGL